MEAKHIEVLDRAQQTVGELRQELHALGIVNDPARSFNRVLIAQLRTLATSLVVLQELMEDDAETEADEDDAETEADEDE